MSLLERVCVHTAQLDQHLRVLDQQAQEDSWLEQHQETALASLMQLDDAPEQDCYVESVMESMLESSDLPSLMIELCQLGMDGENAPEPLRQLYALYGTYANQAAEAIEPDDIDTPDPEPDDYDPLMDLPF